MGQEVQREEIRRVETQIKELYDNNREGLLLEAKLGLLKKMEGKKDSLLLQEE